MQYVLGAAYCGAGRRGPGVSTSLAGSFPCRVGLAGPGWMTRVWVASHPSLLHIPELGGWGTTSGKVSVRLGLMCPSQHAICTHQKLRNPSADCLFLENRAGRTSREWRLVSFPTLCSSQPTTFLGPSSFSRICFHTVRA